MNTSSAQFPDLESLETFRFFLNVLQRSFH